MEKKANTLLPNDVAIEQTKNWIKNVVIDCNFCPFAAKALKEKTIHYTVLSSTNIKQCLEMLLLEMKRLDSENKIETTFVIFKNDFKNFSDYLNLVSKAENFLAKNNYEGVYQLASFHPQYCFADATEDDPANYTNRSVYPMLHLLREESITKALTAFPNAEKIPQHNIEFARAKGLEYMQLLRAACM